MTMHTSTDLISQRLGFGCGRLKGGAEKANALRLVHAALDLGLRYFDTAPPYGLGASESVLGDALKGRPENVVVATKAGLARPASPGLMQTARAIVKPLARWVPGLRQAVLKGMAQRAPVGNFGVEFIARSFVTSLQQLQRERLDFLLLHEAHSSDQLEPLQALLDRCVARGQLGAYGSSTGEAKNQLVHFGSVLQYRCPAPGAEWTPVAPCDVLHGAFRFVAPAIWPAMDRDPHLRAQLGSLLPPGTDPATATGALALAYALARFESRMIISTDHPQRLTTTIEQVRHITASSDWHPAMSALHAAFKRAPAP
jgi:aryl-alcohol dehydrogenase-like predicted oxidoreductase